MKDEELKELLENMSHNELVDILEHIMQDKTFANALKDFIEAKLKDSGEDDAREEVNDSFCQMRPRGNSYNRYDDTDWYAIMEDCHHLFKKALQALSWGDLRRAVAYPLEWLNCFYKNFTEEAFSYDHEGIKFSMACEEAMNIIEKAMTNPAADADFKEDVYFELSNITKDTTIFDDYCFANLRVFVKRLEAMTQSNEDALSNVEELIEKHEFGVSLADLIIQKANILFTMNKKEEAIRFLENNVCETEVCEYLVTILKEQQDYDRALAALEKAIRIGDGFYSLKWLQKELEIFELQGRNEEVTSTYRKLFIHSYGDMSIYEKLKERINPIEWKDYLHRLMDETGSDFYCYDKNKKAEILKAENDIQGLFDYMCATPNDYKLDLYQVYAIQLPLEYQVKLIPYYMDALRDEAASAKKRDHYQMVRYHMLNLQEIQNGKEAIKVLLAEFRDLYRRRPSFMNELKLIDGE